MSEMELAFLPWLLATLAAMWFGWMAYRADRSPTLWAVGGATFALVTSTIVLGLGQAVSIPYSDQDRAVEQAEWVVTAVALIAVLGWVLTLSLHGHHLAVWRAIKSDSGPAEPFSAESKPGTVTLRK